MAAARDLVWDGCLNVRDLGGLDTADGGETRFGSVIRADSVGQLNPAGWEALVGAGVTRIVDLREGFEITEDPPRGLDVEVVHVPILDHYDEESWDEIRTLSEQAPTNEEAQLRVYLSFLEHCRPRFVQAVAAVADAPAGAVVVHCHAGKDRTGLVVALLLRLAGVAIEIVAEDYALSGERLRPRHEEWLASAEDEVERSRIARISSTPYESMRGVLETLDDQYGGVERYLLDGGLQPAELDAARARLR